MNVILAEFFPLRLWQNDRQSSKEEKPSNLREERKIMGTRRHVESAMCIFDLTIGKAIGRPESIRAKVMMLYCRRDNRREFKILDLSFPEDLDRQIISWLEKNTEPDDILWELESNRMDADSFRQSSPCLGSEGENVRVGC